MQLSNHARRWPVALVIAIASGLGACGSHEAVGPSTNPPAAIDAMVDLTHTAQVGTPVTGGIIVKVSDASGRPVPGAVVAFAVTVGNGTVAPRVAVSDPKGLATVTWTLGTVVGSNELTATVDGVTTPIKFEAVGTSGPVASLSLSSNVTRLLATVDSVRITARSVDSFGNTTSPSPSFLTRDPTLITVDSTGLVRALRRGAGTYVVVTAGKVTDSVLVTVLADGQSLCTGTANPTELAVGQTITDVSGQGFCVHASSDNTEYAIVPYYDSPTPGSSIQVEVRALGLGVLTNLVSATDLIVRSPAAPSPAPALIPDEQFESQLRQRERTQLPAYLAGARSALRASPDLSAAKAGPVPAVGDLVSLNVNPVDACTNADLRAGRVAAITEKAIIVTDTSNPPGGFTDAEYQSIGVTFDTLVDPTDRAAFGAPTDIDANGRVIMFFTRAVNELTPANASSVVLGFFIQRDLLPKTGSPGPCPASNAGEMFYLLVPDTGGVVNSNKRSKSQVVTTTNGTVAHEYQHLINASRRMYVNGVGENFEQTWLDEGLAHEAEELNFYGAAGRAPRQNIDAAAFSDPKFVAAYSTFALNNIRRYETYLGATETQGPIGSSPFDDDLQTRGAIWDFLRFAADHLPAGTENAFWFNLVNSTTSGVANLTNALGAAPNSLMRDWAISVFLDDNAVGVDPRFAESSWNFRSVITGGSASSPFPLTPRILRDAGATTVQLAANGVSFLRFTVPAGQDALLTTTSNNLILPPTVKLAIVRVH